MIREGKKLNLITCSIYSIKNVHVKELSVHVQLSDPVSQLQAFPRDCWFLFFFFFLGGLGFTNIIEESIYSAKM